MEIDSNIYAKYQRMLKYGVPEKGVRDCMMMDGVPAEELEAYMEEVRPKRKALLLSKQGQIEEDELQQRLIEEERGEKHLYKESDVHKGNGFLSGAVSILKRVFFLR